MAMMNKIKEVYPHFNIEIQCSDAFVVDYTEQTQSKRGVEVLTEKPVDISSFKISNPNNIAFGTVVFDKYSFVKSGGGSESQCECMGLVLETEANAWLLLIELKYCKYKNARKNFNDGRDQVFATYDLLKQTGVIANTTPCYLCVSLPQQDNTPFDGWVYSPDEKKDLKNQKNIDFAGVNEITILSNTVIRTT